MKFTSQRNFLNFYTFFIGLVELLFLNEFIMTLNLLFYEFAITTTLYILSKVFFEFSHYHLKFH